MGVGFYTKAHRAFMAVSSFFFFLWDFCGGLSGSCRRTDCPTTPFWSSNIPKFGGFEFRCGRFRGCGCQASLAGFPGFQGLFAVGGGLSCLYVNMNDVA